MNWMIKTGCLFLLWGTAMAEPLTAALEKHYQGTIGDRSRIYMRLTTQGNQLSGAYTYEWVGESIDLKGERTAGDGFRLQEFVTDKKNKSVLSGVFKGNFSGGSQLQGSWSSADGKKTLPFRLAQVGVTVNHYKENRAIELVADLEEGKKRELEVTFPQITGLTDKDAETRVNKILREKVFSFNFRPSYRELVHAHEIEPDDTQDESISYNETHGFFQTREYAVRYNANSLLSFTVDNMDQWGGPYPNVDEEYVVLDTKKGELLTLEKVIKKDRLINFKQALCRRVRDNGLDSVRCDELQNADSSGGLPCYGLDSSAPEFYVDQSGMGFDLECEPHAVYATGLIRLPYKDIENFIDPTGPLKSFLKR